MKARIFNENGDYVVYAEIISPDGYTTFKPLRNFGCRQSDAIEYRDSDLKDVKESRINFLIKTYKPTCGTNVYAKEHTRRYTIN